MSEEKKSGWESLVKGVVDWFKTVGPLAIFAAISRYFKRKAWFAERKTEETELKLKHHENEAAVEKENSGKSDLDIVRDAISEGQQLDE